LAVFLDSGCDGWKPSHEDQDSKIWTSKGRTGEEGGAARQIGSFKHTAQTHRWPEPVRTSTIGKGRNTEEKEGDGKNKNSPRGVLGKVKKRRTLAAEERCRLTTGLTIKGCTSAKWTKGGGGKS